MKILVLVLLLLTGCTKAQPELRETKEVQTSIPYSDEELIVAIFKISMFEISSRAKSSIS